MSLFVIQIIIVSIILISPSTSLLLQKQQHVDFKNVIKLNNEVKLINKYENITLQCPTTTSGNDESDEIKQEKHVYLIKWFKNDESLKLFNKNKIRVVNNNYLIIKNFNVYDIGLYKCQIINGNGIVKTFNVTLKVNLTNKEINELLFNYDASIGNEEDDEEENDDDFIGSSIDTNPNAYDYYMRGGEAPTFVDLDSLMNKQFQKLEHSNIELSCNARGLPMPDIMWLKNNQVISEEYIGNARNSMVLKISNLNIFDSGIYTCQLTNQFGKINRTFVVNVYEQIGFKGLDPANQTVVYGSYVKFNCEIADNYDKQVTQTRWLVQYSNDKYTENANPSDLNLSVEINNELYVYINENDKKFEVSRNYLLIKQVTYQDTGFYLCIINNSRGYNYRKAYLNVIQSLTNQILFKSSSNSSSAPNIPLITVLLIVLSSITAFIILGLFIYFCKNKSHEFENKSTKQQKIIHNKPRLQQQQQQQVQLLQHHQHPPAFSVPNSLRKSITSQRSSHVNTTNTNTNSTTVTKLVDLNSSPESYLLLNNQQQQQQQQIRLLYQLNNNTENNRRVPEYDNYKQHHFQSNAVSLSIDDDMIDWSDSSSNMSRPYAKIHYNNKD